ncbi:TnsA endonuclease N-terminal domain-containing protein [Lyngbya sp. PCC 8106]|uniref:TnsA endonuclease N-terminal domain-containing protein n=1 Tax=Lyngbya sp. (strain PCC 8106) TaxID=313612 RepID=UPI0000EA9E7F|nr:TnsA endonuclease N-terminal domain-containing protein [Lyngbya sp. PCC 8106]EAW36765.1 hypothetical protein L8106_29975 [Lyngbya sp. PCC 8106]
MNVPARKITNTGTRKNIGKFSSRKMGQIVWYESLLELDYIYLLEIDPDVVAFASQPFQLQYTIIEGGKRRKLKYTPDFYVERKNQIQVVEVKPENKVNSERNQRIFHFVAPIFREKGWEFVVVTETMIRVQPQLNNVKLLHRYSGVEFSLQNLIDCQEYFQKLAGQITIEQAERELRSKGITRSFLFRWIYSGFLKTNLEKPINSQSLIHFEARNTDFARG